MGGFETNQTTTSTTTESTTWKGSTFNTGTNLTVNATEDVNIVSSDVEVEGDIKAKNINIYGRQDVTEITNKTKVETESLEIGVKNAYVDAALAIDGITRAWPLIV